MVFDLLIVGSGTAAMVAAFRVRAAGWSVAIVDEKPFGGTCALRGCDPKKMLVAGAEVVEGGRRMQGHGVVGQVSIDWRELIGFKRTFTDPIPEKHQQRYDDKGIATFHGRARFIGSNSLSINGSEVQPRQFFYDCKHCAALLRPLKGDCCVFCSSCDER